MNDGGLAVVRLKPLGAGGGGGESSAGTTDDDDSRSLSYNLSPNRISIGGRCWKYPRHIVPPGSTQEQTYNEFLPVRIQSFLDGFNVNILAYGQTGSGKTHTMFGPPGIMGRAAAGEYGLGITPDYGIFPRAIISIFNELKHRSNPCVLVASTIELAITGAVDMLIGEVHHGHYQAHQQTITVDNSADPPKAIGQSCIVINDERDILKVFSAISSRNTAGTGMNDSSSRSHCFAWLTLYSYDPARDKLQTSRFQFVDLAGSERLKDAHNGNTNVRSSTADMNLIAGAVNNYSLMMLSTCIRDIVRALKSRSWDGHISYRKYLVPLVPLLSESLTGEAPSLIVVCLSQATANVMQCKFALDFGFTFSNLAVGSRKKRPERLAKLEKIARETKVGAEAALEGAHSQSKTRNLREAQLVDSKNFLVVVDLLRK